MGTANAAIPRLPSIEPGYIDCISAFIFRKAGPKWYDTNQGF